MKKILAFVIVILLSGIGVHAMAKSDYKKIGIEIDGKKLDVEAYSVDGSTMVPLRAIFEKLQAEVKWEQSSQSITAKKGSTTVKLRLNDTSAQVNDKSVTLEVPPMDIKSSTFVPLRFVSEALGAQVAYDSKRQIVAIQTTANGNANSNSNSNSNTNSNSTSNPKPSAKAEPFVVKGRATDRQGKPLAGVEIIAENQLERKSKLTTITDEDGYYQIDLPEINTTWYMVSYYEHKFEGQIYEFNLTSVIDQSFGAKKGAVRDFLWDDITGSVAIGIFDYPENPDWPDFSLDDVELTLTPLTPLIDGTKGKAITEISSLFTDGTSPGLKSVPIAKYEITARWVPDGIDPVPMVVADYGSDKYADSFVTANFESVSGTKKRVAIRVAFPQ
ncbi:stalk domain-containing protein [Cohnella cholangitidis]|uniref:stalk domain-containing protein n=1 Tax=Cohnella cholangitidis TaxID=2598458 RepID=UPI0015F94B2E|nr:stalk domain-containing protein [Cohnella cholangitidis]